MAELQRARKALDVPINDIMLASVAGAVGRYYALRGARMTGLRAMVPMSLRTDSEKHALGNRVGMLNIELPVGEVDPERRLKIIHRRTHQAKRDGRGAIYPFLTQALGLLPGFALKTFVQGSMERVNLVCTNIPGIKQPRWFAGRMIERIIPYAPVVEGCPLSIALFSYRNDLEIGIATDPEAIPDPEKIRAHLADAYAEIITLASTREHTPRPSLRRRRRGKKH
jgi:WS/DGAT/MGAT family acyltransferase